MSEFTKMEKVREQKDARKPGSSDVTLKETMKSWLPTEPEATLFVLVMLVCLVVSVIRFASSGDTSMLTSLLVYAAAYAGLPKVKAGLTEIKPLFSAMKKADEKEENA